MIWTRLMDAKTTEYQIIIPTPYKGDKSTVISVDVKTAQALISTWLDKKGMIHLHNGKLLGHKKKKVILPFATAWMDLEIIMLNEINQSEKDKYYMISLVCGI